MSETKRLGCRLTLQQAEQVEWALDPMADHWCSEAGADARDGEVLPESSLPVLGPCPGSRGPQKTSKALTLSDVPEVNDDLLYRLEEQLPDMQRQAEGKGFDSSDRSVNAALNAARRIRHAIKHS